MNNYAQVTFEEAFDRTSYNIQHCIPTLITGRAGTGKSSLLRDLKEEHPFIHLLSFTNLAARNINGNTLHKNFNLPHPGNPNRKPKHFKYRRTDCIDEASNVGMGLLNRILECQGKNSNIIISGDPGQMPPIKDDSIFPFLEKYPNIEKFELTHNYRQAEDPDYQTILNDLYDNGQTKKVRQFIESRMNITPFDPEKSIYVAIRNAEINAYNKKFNKSTIGTLVRGNNNRSLIKNNEMGEVIGITNDGKLTIRLFNNDEIIGKNHPAPKDFQKVDVFPKDIEIAQGITIHKSQGKTYEYVIIDMEQIDTYFPQALYVAMSRVKHADNVYFIDRGKRSKLISFPIGRGGSGVNETNIEEKKKKFPIKEPSAPYTGGPNAENKYVYSKKYGSVPLSDSFVLTDSMILLNPYYLGKNNGFTEWRRNKLLVDLELKKRINRNHKNRDSLWQKKPYEFEESPVPFFMYSPDCKKIEAPDKVSTYETLNPMKPGSTRRSNENCYSKTRFLFEIDCPKDIKNSNQKKNQKKKKRAFKKAELARAKELFIKEIVNRITYSGNLSYHCIIEISYEVPDYKAFWEWLNEKYFGGKADKGCSDPSHWTRTPGQKHQDGRLQRGFGIRNSVFDPTEELKEMELKKELKKEITEKKMAVEKELLEESNKEAATSLTQKSKEELFKLAIAKEIEIEKKRKSKSFPYKPQAQELLDGIFPYDEFQKWGMIAINDLHNHGYAPDKIWKLLEKAEKDKKGRDRRDKVKEFVRKNRAYKRSNKQ